MTAGMALGVLLMLGLDRFTPPRTREHRPLRPGLRPGGQGPVGDVVAGVAQHGDALEHAGHQVHPALIDKNTFVYLDNAVVVQLALPPLQISMRVGCVAHGTKPQLGARAADIELGGAIVVGDGVEQVGRKDDVSALPQQRLHFRQGLYRRMSGSM